MRMEPLVTHIRKELEEGTRLSQFTGRGAINHHVDVVSWRSTLREKFSVKKIASLKGKEIENRRVFGIARERMKEYLESEMACWKELATTKKQEKNENAFFL